MLDEFYFAAPPDGDHHLNYQGESVFLEVTSSDDVECIPGAAARVAASLAALGIPTQLVSVTGADGFATLLLDVIRRMGVAVDVIADPSRPTIRKLRIFFRNLPTVPPTARLDVETRDPLDRVVELQLLDHLRRRMERSSALIIVDYSKGLLSRDLIRQACSLAEALGIPVYAHPRRALAHYLDESLSFDTVFMTTAELRKFSAVLGVRTGAATHTLDIPDTLASAILEGPLRFRKLMVLDRERCAADPSTSVCSSALFVRADSGEYGQLSLLRPPPEIGSALLEANVGLNLAAFAGFVYGSVAGNSDVDAQQIATLTAHVHAAGVRKEFASCDELLSHSFVPQITAQRLGIRVVENSWLVATRLAVTDIGDNFQPTTLLPGVYSDDSGALQEFLLQLKHVVDRGVHCVVRGDSGSGKTYVVRRFLDHAAVQYANVSAPEVQNIAILLQEFAVSYKQVLLLDEFLAVEAAFRPALATIGQGTVLIGDQPTALNGRFIIGLGSTPDIAPDVRNRFGEILEFPSISREPRALIVELLTATWHLMNQNGRGFGRVSWRQILAFVVAAREPAFSLSRRQIAVWARDIVEGKIPEAWRYAVEPADRLAMTVGLLESGVTLDPTGRDS